MRERGAMGKLRWGEWGDCREDASGRIWSDRGEVRGHPVGSQRLRFISSFTSPHSLPLSSWYYLTAYIARRPLGEQRESGWGEEWLIEMPLYTFSPIMVRPPVVCLVLYCFLQMIRNTCKLIPMKQRHLLPIIAICQHLVISCISFWFRNFCLWSVSWLS